MKKAKSDLLTFIIGIAMLAIGFYIFSAKVTVTTGFGFHFGRVNINGGVVVVPMLAGVFWWFITPKKIAPKILTGIGAAIIVASVVMNTRFYFTDNLFNYILMLVMMVGGAALVLASLSAEGVSEVDGVSHIERGYFEFDKKLRSLGADIEKYD